MWLVRVVLEPGKKEYVFQCAVCDVGKAINAEN
jgi:hypothetical protein